MGLLVMLAHLWAAPFLALATPGPHTLTKLEPDALSTWTLERPMSSSETVRQVASAPPIRRDDGFDQAVVSWNLRASPGRCVGVEIRVGNRHPAGGDERVDPVVWSPWVAMGEWTEPVGSTPGAPGASGAFPTGRVTRFDLPGGAPGGEVDVDLFRSPCTYQFIQVRLVSPMPALAGQSTPPPPAVVSGLWLCLTNTARSRERSVGAPPSGPPVSIPVPFRSQKTKQKDLAGRLCSPTSVAMVMAHFGVNQSVYDVAMRGYDQRDDLFGTWPRATQAAFSFGVPGYVTRFASWDEVAQTLAAGQPIIASITVKEGELRNAPYKSTGGGHLIVLTGLDGSGGVLVNDPACSDELTGRRVYFADDLTNVWLRRKQGTAYILLAPDAPAAPSRAP